MKEKRQAKIIELIGSRQIETQEELCALLVAAGFCVTQATVSRDIRELKLTKIALPGGGKKYAIFSEPKEHMHEKYHRVFKDGVLSIDMAQNILVVHTASGMAMAVAMALDTMNCKEIVGTIAGDDTIMCAVRTVEETVSLMGQLRRLLQ